MGRQPLRDVPQFVNNNRCRFRDEYICDRPDGDLKGHDCIFENEQDCDEADTKMDRGDMDDERFHSNRDRRAGAI